MNDRIEPELCSLSYVSIDGAIEAILRAGRGASLAKVDIAGLPHWLTSPS